MYTFRHSQTVKAPAPAAFGALTEFEAIPKFVPQIVGARQLSQGPVQVGTLFEQDSKFMGRVTQVKTEVTEFEPNRRLAYRALDGPFKYRAHYDFLAEGRGTRIDYTVEVPFPLYLAPLAPVLGRWFEKAYVENMATFARLVESGELSDRMT